MRVKRLGETTLVLRGNQALRPKSVAKTVQHLPEECSSCDERTKANRPAAAKFAQQRLDQRRQRFKPVKPHLTAIIRRFRNLRKKKETRHFPQAREDEEEEEEEEEKEEEEEEAAAEEEEEDEADPGSDVDFSGDDTSSGGPGWVSLSNSSCCVIWLKQERGRLKPSKRNSTK